MNWQIPKLQIPDVPEHDESFGDFVRRQLEIKITSYTNLVANHPHQMTASPDVPGFTYGDGASDD